MITLYVSVSITLSIKFFIFFRLKQFFCFSAIDTIIKKKPLSEGQKGRKYRKYTSRVHVEDICQALMATVYAPSPR